MLKDVLGNAARPRAGNLRHPLDIRLEQEFDGGNYKGFRGLLGVILQQYPKEDLPYETFERIMYRAATLGREEYCTLLHDHVRGKSYLDGSLNFTAMHGDLKAMSVFLEHGADIHNNDDQPLRSAVIGMHQASVDFLRQRGCVLASAINPDTVKSIKALGVGLSAPILDFLSLQSEQPPRRGDNRPGPVCF